MDNKGDFLAGMIVGAVIGAALGILFAPASGSETRAQVVEKGAEIRDLAKEKAKEKSDSVVSATKELMAKLRERLPKIREVQDVLDQAAEEISQA
jgi:gas vesicle protein